MSRRAFRRLALALSMALAAAPVLAAAPGPGLGRVATPEEVARVDISITPDGHNLPPGSGNVSQGAAVYAAKCVSCHGERGAGGQGLIGLTGGIVTRSTVPLDAQARGIAEAGRAKTVSAFWPYATTLFDYIRRAMPLDAPMSLTNDEVYAVTAYILSIDGIVAPDATLDAVSLPQVKMPNREGFLSWWPPPEGATAPGQPRRNVTAAIAAAAAAGAQSRSNTLLVAGAVAIVLAAAIAGLVLWRRRRGAVASAP